MIVFKDNEDGQVFEFSFTATAKNGVFKELNIVTPQDYKISPSLQQILVELVFPLENCMIPRWDTSPYINSYINSQLGVPFYVYVKYFRQASDTTAYAVVSKYLMPRLLSWVVDSIELSSIKDFLDKILLSKFHKTQYDIEISMPPEIQCPYTTELSGESESCNLLNFFLSNYPPHYIAALIGFLLCSKRVIVTSSSPSVLTRIVLTIASFFYPLQLPNFVYPLFSSTTISAMDNGGPMIAGLHTSMLNLLSKPGRSEYVLFNADEPCISVHNVSALDDVFMSQLPEFTDRIQRYVTASQPVFPGQLIKEEIQSFIITSFTNIWKSDDGSFNRLRSLRESKASQNSQSIDVVLSKSVIYESIFKQGSQNNGDNVIRESYWPEDTPSREHIDRIRVRSTYLSLFVQSPMTDMNRKNKSKRSTILGGLFSR